MANMTLELANIANAVLGPEMKTSIYTGINKINIESETGLSTLSEYDTNLNQALQDFSGRADESIGRFTAWFDNRGPYISTKPAVKIASDLIDLSDKIDPIEAIEPPRSDIYNPQYTLTWYPETRSLHILGRESLPKNTGEISQGVYVSSMKTEYPELFAAMSEVPKDTPGILSSTTYTYQGMDDMSILMELTTHWEPDYSDLDLRYTQYQRQGPSSYILLDLIITAGPPSTPMNPFGGAITFQV